MRSIIISLFLLSSEILHAQANQNEVRWNQDASGITLHVSLTTNVQDVKIQIRSDRNTRITKITDISAEHPEPQTVLPTPIPNKQIWYPVVDIVRNPGMKGHIILDSMATISAWNQHFFKKSENNKKKINLEADRLEDWENSLYIEPRARQINDFYIQQIVQPLNGTLNYHFTPLSEEWKGTITIRFKENGVAKTINHKINWSKVLSKNWEFTNSNLSQKNLKLALSKSIDYLLRSQNKNKSSLTYGGLNLFYDLDAQSYRSNHWIWGSGPAVKVLLNARKINGLHLSTTNSGLLKAAEKIGQSAINTRIMDPNHAMYGVPLSRWRRDIILPDFGYQQCYSTSDANFFSGWAWIPLYTETGNKAYLEAAKLLAETTDRLMTHYGLIPQDYYIDEKKFSEHTIDESGFGTEGLANLFVATNDQKYFKMTEQYIQEHLKKLSRADGLWERGWHQKTGVQPTIKMTRGLGWAMEGLLAAHRNNPRGPYLSLAKKMADRMFTWQKPDGHWNFITDESVEKVGISEKGTALWSYLLYQLYAATGDKKYVAMARKSLTWCINNQYQGPDRQAYGGIVGKTIHSAVGAAFRPWFPITCAYTSAFFSLAIMEELNLTKNEK
jgi:rhamnogalacturonyl hydrolase YesR